MWSDFARPGGERPYSILRGLVEIGATDADGVLGAMVEAAGELTETDLGLVLEAARRAPRPVILRNVRDG